MKRPDPALDVSNPELFSMGVQYDLHPLQIPLVADGRNVKFGRGKIKTTKGYTTVAQGAVQPVRGLGQNIKQNGVRQLFWGTWGSLNRWNAVDVVTKNLAGGSVDAGVLGEATAWSFWPFGDWMIATDGERTIQIDKGAGAGFVDLDPADRIITTAKHVSGFANFVLYFGTSDGNAVIRWSKSDSPEYLRTVAEGALEGTNSGILVLRELDGLQMAVNRIGNNILVYGEDQSFIVGYRGAPFWFGYEKGIDGIGAVGKLAVTSDGRRNYGFSRRGFWVSDGTSHEYPSEGYVSDFLKDRVNWAQASKSFCWRNDSENRIELGIPIDGATEPNFRLGFDLTNRSFLPLDGPITSGLERGAIGYPILGLSNGKVATDGTAETGDGLAPISHWVRTKPFYLGTTELAYYLDQFEVLMGKAPAGTEIRFGCSEDLGNGVDETHIRWEPWVPVDTSLKTHYTQLEGTFLYIELRGEGSWEWQGILMYGRAYGLDRGTRT